MKLGEYLRANSISPDDFAKAIGRSKHGVSKWVRGVRTPRGVHMQAIIKATKGDVTANDFLPSRTNEAAE